MTIKAEFASWFFSPKTPTASAPPQPGDHAPATPQLKLAPNRASIVVFLRHCGCPFSEKSYLLLRAAALSHRNIDFITVSHSNDAATQKWLQSIPKPKGPTETTTTTTGGEPENLRLVVDATKEVYAAWGLGAAGVGHVINPQSLVEVIKLSAKGGISARATDSGSRWQTSGHYAVDGEGRVVWGGPAKRADDIINLQEAFKALGVEEATEA